jgi:hypothetical protein
MPNARLHDGARVFDRLHGPYTTVVGSSEGVRILVRPDGYVGDIGKLHCAEYGEPTQE